MWADTICINQEDVTERDDQVTIMGTILGPPRQFLHGSENLLELPAKSLTLQKFTYVLT